MNFILLFFLMLSHLAYASEKCENVFEGLLLSDTDKSLFGRRASKVSKKLRKEYRSRLKDISMFVPFFHISNVEFLSEESSIPGYKIALLNNNKVYLKEMPDGRTEDIFASLQTLNFIGVPVLFRGVVEAEEGLSYMMYKFEEGGIANSFSVKNISENSLIKDKIEEKLLKIKKFFSQYGVYAEDLEFLVTPESNIYVMRYSNMDFLGKPLSRSMLEEVEMEFHHIIKNIRRNWGVLSLSSVGNGSSDKSVEAPEFVDNGSSDKSVEAPEFIGNGSSDKSVEAPEFVGNGLSDKSVEAPEFVGNGSSDKSLEALEFVDNGSSDTPLEPSSLDSNGRAEDEYVPMIEDVELSLKQKPKPLVLGEEREPNQENKMNHFEDDMQLDLSNIPVVDPIDPEELARQERALYGGGRTLPADSFSPISKETYYEPTEPVNDQEQNHFIIEDTLKQSEDPVKEESLEILEQEESLEMLAQTLGLPEQALEILAQTLGLPLKEPEASAKEESLEILEQEESLEMLAQTLGLPEQAGYLEILAQTLGLPLKEPEAPAKEESLEILEQEESLEMLAQTLGLPLKEPEDPAKAEPEPITPLAVGEKRLKSLVDENHESADVIKLGDYR